MDPWDALDVMIALLSRPLPDNGAITAPASDKCSTNLAPTCGTTAAFARFPWAAAACYAEMNGKDLT